MATGTWDLLAPEVSTNYVKNPAAGNGTTDWSIAGGTSGGALSVDTTASNILFDNQVLKFTGTTVGAGRGPQCTLSAALASATTQVQAWVSGATPTALLLGATSKAPTLLRTEGSYSVYGATFTGGEASGQTTAQVGFAAGALMVYVYMQVEQSSTYTTFIHGNAGPGCVWNGAAHQSSSTRYILDPDGKVVYGGSITALDDRASVVCEAQVGVGLLPYTVESLSLAGETPALYVKHDLHARDIQLSLTFAATSLATSHTARAALLAKLPYGREVWLRYNGANSVLQIRAAVSGQFDLRFDDNEPFGKRTVIAFQALDPKFALIYADTTALTLASSPSSSYARQRTDAAGWAAMSSGLFAVPRRAVTGPDGTIYVGTLASGGSAKLQKWTGSAWADVGGAFTGSITGGPILYDLVPNADWTVLYVLGDFTTVGGTAGFGGVAAITLSSGAAAKLGAGVSAGGVPLCGAYIKSLSRLYVGGLFTGMNSVANTGYFCYWDGAAWQSVGTTRPTAGVYCMVNDGADNLILGGDFTNTFSLTTSTSPTLTVANGGDLSASTDYYVWVIPCDGTSFTFASPGGTGSLGITGVGAVGPAQRAVVTTTTAGKQFLASWTAVPGARFYVLWIGTLAYTDGTTIANGPHYATGQYFDELFGRGSLGAQWSNTNGTMTYETTLSNVRYASGSLKYTGTSLAASSGVYWTIPSSNFNSDTWTFGAWIKGSAPDKFGLYTTGLSWTYSGAPTASITDGTWTYYTASIASGTNFTRIGVFYSGTITSYVGYLTAKSTTNTNGIFYLTYTNARALIAPAGVTSAYIANLTTYSAPDVPNWNYAPGGYGTSPTSDYYLVEGTGSFGSRIVKHKTADASWERMAQPGGGFNGIVRSLAWAGSTLVAAGDFTSVDNATAGRVAYTRGKAWLPLGVSGMSSGSVHRVSYVNGTLWAVGSFASADSDTSATLVARMDGFPTGRWTHADLALTNSSNTVYDVIPQAYSLALFDDTTFSSAAGGTSVTYSGTGNLYPRIVATGPGLLRWIENRLTRTRIILNYTLQAGEKLIIDCDKATATSNLYGDVTGQVAPSSNLDGFYLVASSTQTIWCHMTGTTGASSVVIQGNRSMITGDV